MFNKIKAFINNSFLMDNINSIAFLVLLLMLFVSIFCPSEIIGLLAVTFSFLIIFKTIFSNNNLTNILENHEKPLIIFFLIVTTSLFASTLFSLSLHGYIKTLIYIVFFFCASLFFKDKQNNKKILFLMFFISLLMSYESIVAIIQNLSGVNEISGWQDTSNINPEQIISRAYGTLKPYNPNLLAGYLLCGLSSIVYLILYYLKNNKKIPAICFLILFLTNLTAIFDTGCRGAYLGFMFFFPVLFLALGFYIYQNYGGLSKIKQGYKNTFLSLFICLTAFILSNPALIKRFESIFAFRNDSSISFRMNVYESCWRMFLDNPIFGIGCGNQNFREIYGLYMKTGYDALGSYCVPLELMVESGIFALITFVLFLYFVIKKCSSICLTQNSKINDRILALSIILMICAAMGHGLFDTIWFRPQVQILFWLNIAMLKTVEK